MDDIKVDTTETKVNVFITVWCQCPKCNRKIKLTSTLDYDSLVTGNTTQQASYHADEMFESIEVAKRARGWTSNFCGRCRDSD